MTHTHTSACEPYQGCTRSRFRFDIGQCRSAASQKFAKDVRFVLQNIVVYSTSVFIFKSILLQCPNDFNVFVKHVLSHLRFDIVTISDRHFAIDGLYKSYAKYFHLSLLSLHTYYLYCTVDTKTGFKNFLCLANHNADYPGQLRGLISNHSYIVKASLQSNLGTTVS